MIQLSSLQVRNIRGVRELAVDLGDKSIVLLGPNGAGKSSVVDALDFLLTGEVRRLSGEGAGALSLTDHGCNLLAKPDDAWVEGTFTVLDGTSKRAVKLKRTVTAPSQLITDGKASPVLADLLARVGRSKHHLLSRREILKYILAQPSARHEQVGALMQLDAIEDLRKELQGAAKKGREDLKALKGSVQRYEGSVLSCVKPAALDLAQVLAVVNAHRAVLGALPIAALEEAQVRGGVQAPSVSAPHPLQSARTTETLVSLVAALSRRTTLLDRLRGYAADVGTLRADQAALAAHQAHALLTRGLALATGDECPLCRHDWSGEDLRALLLARIEASVEASERVEALVKRRSALVDELEEVRDQLQALVRELSRGTGVPAQRIQLALDAVTIARAVVVPEAVAGPVPTAADLDAFAAVLDDVSTAVSALDAEAKLLPPPGRVGAIWEELAAVERALHELAKARADVPAAERLANALAAADKVFTSTRSDVLAATYSKISGRLQHLYAGIHGEGAGAEKEFSASLEAEKAGLKLEVDFYGKGRFPPAALHSEGHQDTLGICLFLALAEHVSAGPITFLILDDVLMSVDAEHRRAVAEMLRKEYPNTQFVITTHDEVWARQLQSVGISPKLHRLTTWTLEGGTVTTVATKDPIVASRAALAEGRVETAAHALRRGLEERLRELCLGLNGKVRFKAGNDYDLGDFRDAVKAAFADALAKAMKAAVSRAKDTASLAETQSAYNAASKLVESEEWSINKTVHFNDWATMTVGDFKPVIDAYDRFLGFFQCKACGGDLRILKDPGLDLEELRCSCGETNFNLQPKPKAKSA
jgi:energy-coupling factor transporter ATP-binding protein EcfA2